LHSEETLDRPLFRGSKEIAGASTYRRSVKHERGLDAVRHVDAKREVEPMRTRAISKALAASLMVICIWQPAAAQGQATPQAAQPVSIQEFRQLVIRMANALNSRPGGSPAATKLREKIEAADAQALDVMYNARADWTELRHAVQLMTSKPTPADAPPSLLFGPNPLQAALVGTLPYEPFPPAYPTGSNYATFRATLPGLGAMSDTNGDGSLDDERCDANFEAGVAIASAVFSFASIAIDLGCHALPELLDIPCFVAAEVVALAAEATNTVAAQCALVDGAVDATEIEAAFENTVRLFGNLGTHHGALVQHDTEIKTQLATHDTDIKALLAILQAGVNDANQRLKVSETLQRQIIKLLLTPEGLRAVDPAALSCTGDNCPKILDCPGTECTFPIKK
jgi:hypothetical protein